MTDLNDIVRCLIIDDDLSLLADLKTALEPYITTIKSCATVKDAHSILNDWTPELLVTDVILPDGDAFDILTALCEEQPYPMILAISGAATAEHSFELARLGVHAYLSKPFTLSQFKAAAATACQCPVNLSPHVRSLVGRRPVREVEDEVRTAMIHEALVRTDGSRRGAAKLLNISRQLLQHILRK